MDPALLRLSVVHHAVRSPQPWWRSAVLYEYSLAASEHPELAIECIDQAADLGVHGAVVPTGAAPVERSHAQAIVAAHHDAGLRVLPSLAPARGQRGLLADAETWLECGADGIDLRSALAAGQVEHTGPFHALVHSARDDGLLAGAMRSRDDLAGHLADAWLGHLRDDTLTDVPWEASAIRQAVTTTFTSRDALGASPAWTTTYALYRCGPRGDSWQADRMPVDRVRAVALMVMGLPGAVYLLHGEEVGMRDWSLETDPRERTRRVREAHAQQRQDPASMVEHYRRCLRLRAEYELGTGTVAWVEGHRYGPDLVAALNRTQLLVLNASREAIWLPEHTEVAHSSTSLRRRADGELQLPANAAVMITLPPFAPLDGEA